MKHSRGRGLLALGIMSGTSADGIDVALVRMAGRKASLENFAAFPFPRRVQESILEIGEGPITHLTMLVTPKSMKKVSKSSSALSLSYNDGRPPRERLSSRVPVRMNSHLPAAPECYFSS